MSIASAISQACVAPAPPNAISANSRGSIPCSTVTMRIAFAMFSLQMRTMAEAVSTRSSPSWPPSESSTAFARSGSSGSWPPRKKAGSSRPSTTSASVIVALSPPWP